MISDISLIGLPFCFESAYHIIDMVTPRDSHVRVMTVAPHDSTRKPAHTRVTPYTTPHTAHDIHSTRQYISTARHNSDAHTRERFGSSWRDSVLTLAVCVLIVCIISFRIPSSTRTTQIMLANDPILAQATFLIPAEAFVSRGSAKETRVP